MVYGDIDKGVACDCAQGDAVDLDISNGVAGCRVDGVELVRAAVDGGGPRRGDAATGAGRSGHRVDDDGKGRGDSVVGGDVGKGVAGDCADGDAVNLDVGDGVT